MNHFSHQVEANIKSLLVLKLDKDVLQQAAIEILKGKSLKVALIHADFQVRRENKSCGFVEFDKDGDDMLPLSETIPKAEYEIENWRGIVLNDKDEKFLDLIREGGAHYGRNHLGLSERRGQQKIKGYISRAKIHFRYQEITSGTQINLDFLGLQ